MNALTRLALELQAFCEARKWKFCFIGGLAVQHWGEPRFTKDVDLTLLTGFGGEEKFVDEWLRTYEARLELPREFALRNRVLLLRSGEGIGIDIALGALPFEEEAINRARRIELEPGAFLCLCTPEDLIVMKAFANRALDWNDVRGVVVRQGAKKLDWNYVRRQLAPLCELKEQPEIMERLDALRREVVGTES
jgi:predicted nucleotidyltransferase